MPASEMKPVKGLQVERGDNASPLPPSSDERLIVKWIEMQPESSQKQ
jgi:hypothetical protein